MSGANDPTFRLRTVAEISAYLKDMVEGGAFAGFRVNTNDAGAVETVHIRMRTQDAGNELRRKLTSTVLHATFTSHGAPDMKIIVCDASLWP